jgi:putative ABC transport system substrate-binding protein
MTLIIDRLAARQAILCSVLFALCLPASAQQQRVPRIGYLAADSRAPTHETFRKGLRDLGYVEGKTIRIEWRYAEDKPDRFPELAAELIRLKPDVIVAANPDALSALKQATKTVPIVMTASGGDPVAEGIVASFARPGGNITGLTPLDPQLIGKQLELLKQTLPKLNRLAVMWKSDDSGASTQWQDTQAAAAALAIETVSQEVRASDDLEKAIAGAMRARVDGLLVLRSSLFYATRKEIVSLAEKSRLAGLYPSSEYVEAGGLMSYAENNHARYYRAATYVDKILRGAKPGDLPIEAPTKFELVVNLQAAKQIGITIPQNILIKADRVIK